MFFAYLLFNKMATIEESFPSKFDSVDKYGYSLLYGKWAVIASIGITKPHVNKEKDKIFLQVDQVIEVALGQWNAFDEFIKQKNKDTKYFKGDTANYELYYKVNLLDSDVY